MSLTPLAISVLALLNERDMHPYEMYQLLLDRREDRIVKVRPGSLYHTVERLAEAELIAATGTERSGNRPERTRYAISDAGRDALTARVSELLREPANEYPAFPVALAESHNLDRDTVLELLTQRVAQLQRLMEELGSFKSRGEELEVAEVYCLDVDYMIALRTTERDWLARLADRIESKELAWPKY